MKLNEIQFLEAGCSNTIHFCTTMHPKNFSRSPSKMEENTSEV